MSVLLVEGLPGTGASRTAPGTGAFASIGVAAAARAPASADPRLLPSAPAPDEDLDSSPRPAGGPFDARPPAPLRERAAHTCRRPNPGTILGQGTGVGLAPVASIGERLAVPGTTFSRVFTDREWACCLAKDAHTGSGAGPDSVAAPVAQTVGGAPALGPRALESLAARWAAKEAAVKAWSSLVSPAPPALAADSLDWAEIEVVPDRHERPTLRFHGRVASTLEDLAERLGARLDWSLSLSHEGGLAIALVHLLVIGAPTAHD